MTYIIILFVIVALAAIIGLSARYKGHNTDTLNPNHH